MADTGSNFDWTKDVDALSLTCIRRLPPDTVAEVLELTPASAEPMTINEAYGLVLARGEEADSGPVQIAAAGDWTVLIELNGYLGSDAANLSRLATPGAAVNVYWNVNGVMSFGYALDGQIVRSFDPAGIGGDYGGSLPEEAGLNFDDVDANPAALALTLVERLTALALTEGFLLEQPRTCLTRTSPTDPGVEPVEMPPANPRRRRYKYHDWVFTANYAPSVTLADAAQFENLMKRHRGDGWPAAIIAENAGSYSYVRFPTEADANAFQADLGDGGAIRLSDFREEVY